MLRRDRCDQPPIANPETRDSQATESAYPRALADFFAFVN